MNGLRDATGAHQVGWKSRTVDDDETAGQQHGKEGQTGIEVQCRAELGMQLHGETVTADKKLSRCRETARCFMSLIISQVTDFEMTFLSMAYEKSLLVFHCNYVCMYFVPFLRYSALNNDETLKSGLVVAQGHEMAPFDRPHTTY